MMYHSQSYAVNRKEVHYVRICQQRFYISSATLLELAVVIQFFNRNNLFELPLANIGRLALWITTATSSVMLFHQTQDQHEQMAI